MSSGLVFVLIAALAAGIWSILVSQASREIDPLLGAVIAELTGATIGLALVYVKLRSATLEFSSRSVVLLLIAGVCVLAVDYFALRAYELRLPVTIGAPVLTGGAILVATVIGFSLGESFSLMKVAGILLILSGCVLLGSASGL